MLPAKRYLVVIVKPARGFATPINVWTIGYEGRLLDDLVRELDARRITQLIDVREIARSHKPGFSKGALQRRLETAGVGYHHLPALGSPSSIRHKFRDGGSLDDFFDEYHAYLRSVPEAYGQLREMVSSKPSVLMCFERDHRTCHRLVLAQKLTADGFLIEHIG